MKKQLEQFAAEHTLSRNGNDMYGSALEMLGYLLETDQEIRAAFWSDFTMSIIFTVVGIVVVAMSMVRQQKKVSSGMKKHS